jgi:homoserine kinase
MTAVRVPGSSANLGPGFDGLGMALSLYAEVGIVGIDELPDRAKVADDHHPATIAFRSSGGEGSIWVRSEIPMGRGLGFSGAVRVGGAVLGVRQSCGVPSVDVLLDDAMAQRVIDVTARLEGHADNVAASLLGGVVATNGHRAVRVPLGARVAEGLAVVVWIPDFTTSTSDSRAKLPGEVPFVDAVFNVTHTALLVAALAAGDVTALGEATADRLHQDVRLAKAEPSRAALRAMRDTGAVATWLSGSGPTVAGFVRVDDAERVATALPANGHARVLTVDQHGAILIDV